MGQHYQAEPSFRVVAVATSNAVLLSAPPEVLAETLQTLDQLDRKPRTFVVDVYFADAPPAPAGQPGEAAGPDLKALSGPADDVTARLEAMKQQGRLTGLRRFRVAATEGQRATVNAKEDVPVVTASQRLPGGRFGGAGFTTNVECRNVGTLVEVLPRVDREGVVQLDLRVEDSHVAPTEVGPDGAPAPAVLTNATAKQTVSARAGQAVVATGLRDGGTTPRHTIIVVAVRSDETTEAKPK
jgi:type II secretory pathway component GspD/PulD (secretin)